MVIIMNMIIKIGKKKLRIKDCKGLSSMRGLMFNKMKNIDGALIYGNSVWMPFVKHELDLLFLDKDCKIIDIQHAFPMSLKTSSWTVYVNKKAKYCLELKSGLVNAKKGMKVIII